MKAKKFIILDNLGESLDRYTIIEKNTGDCVAASENGLGVFMYAGNIADNYMCVSFGYAWRKYCDVKKCTKNAINLYLEETTDRRKKFSSLPIDLQKKILDYFSNDNQ